MTYESAAGDRLEFTVVRGDVEITIPVTLELTGRNTADQAS